MNETTTEATALESADILRVLELLPHRYPFLMVDRIVDIDGDESCIGIKNVTINEPHFTGHFPAQPVMPGVLLIEGMAQTAGAMCILSVGKSSLQLVYLLSVDNARFRRPVVPGDVVRYHVTKVRRRQTIWKYAAVAKVEDVVVCEAEITAMMVDK